MRPTRCVSFVCIAILALVGVVSAALAQAPGAGAGAADRMQQYRQMIGQRLTAAGATEQEIQAILAFSQQRTQILTPARDALTKLQEASAPEATEAQAGAALTEYTTVMKTALQELTKAEADLKAKLDLANRPKLHATLLTMGILDNGMPSMSGMGGPGGRFGGPGGAGGPGGGGARGGRGRGGAAPGA